MRSLSATIAPSQSNSPIALPYKIDLSCAGWGLVEVSGEDRLKFLQGLTTGDFLQAPVNSLVYASFLTNKGKVLSSNTFLNMDKEVLILCENNDTQRILQHVLTFVFPLDRVYVRDITSQFSLCTNLGVSSLDFSGSASIANNDDAHQRTYKIPYNGFVPTKSLPDTLHNHDDRSHPSKNRLLQLLSRGFITIAPSSQPSSELTDQTLALCYHLLYTMFRIYVNKPAYPYEILPIISQTAESNAAEGVSSFNTGSSQAKGLKAKKVDFKFNLFELGLANDYLVRDKGCYTGQEIVARTLRSMDVQHTKRVRVDSATSSSSQGIFRRRLRGYMVQSDNIVRRGDETVKIGDNEYDITVTSSCAETLLDLFGNSSSPEIRRYIDLLGIKGDYSEVVEELVRGAIVCVDSRISDGSRLVSHDGIVFEESVHSVHAPNYDNYKLMASAKLLSDQELKSYEESTEISSMPPSPATKAPEVVSDEERKRLKLEAMAKKVEALKAKKKAI
eukprot:gene25401-30671_t